MSDPTITLVALAVASYLLKSAGPLLIGERALPPILERLAGFVPGPLLGALVLTSVAVSGRSFVLDARLAGLAAAALALAFRANFIVVVVAAAATTGAARALGIG